MFTDLAEFSKMLPEDSLNYIYRTNQTNLGFWATIVISLNTGWINVLRIAFWFIFEVIWSLIGVQLWYYNLEIAIGYSHEICSS